MTTDKSLPSAGGDEPNPLARICLLARFETRRKQHAIDVKLSALPDLSDRLLLIEVFANPERFRFNFKGKDFVESDRELLLAGKFADEVMLRGRLKYLRSQCSATVEECEPTLYHRQAFAQDPAFSRLLMPMWGDGHIGCCSGHSIYNVSF